MSILKPALCAGALAIAAAVAIPAIAQQSPQGDQQTAQPAPGPQTGLDGDWRGSRERRSDEDGPRWRRWAERRFGDHERAWPSPTAMRHMGLMARVCGPNGDRIGDRLMSRLERVTQPTAEQRPNFDKLKEAAGKAHEIMRTACPVERSATPTGRLANAEKRLTAMLDAVAHLRPAMDAYYGSLNDEQKARLAMAQPRMMRPGMDGARRRRPALAGPPCARTGAASAPRTAGAASAEREALTNAARALLEPRSLNEGSGSRPSVPSGRARRASRRRAG